MAIYKRKFLRNKRKTDFRPKKVRFKKKGKKTRFRTVKKKKRKQDLDQEKKERKQNIDQEKKNIKKFPPLASKQKIVNKFMCDVICSIILKITSLI